MQNTAALSYQIEVESRPTPSAPSLSISKQDLDDYICITDIAKAKSDSARAADIVRNWLRNRGTLEFLSVWEQIYNPQFKVFESEHFKKQVGLLTFTPSVSEWISNSNFPHENGS
ncbi:KilA-N domain-containing protein [Mogibacterium kristiansenii]|uniref:KilA-N domain-containing protein n=1 Tax=Mogibacterium kristiansenii TaxID=2606708 RepID=UPI002E26DA18